MLIRCWGNTSCKNKPINYTFRPLQYCQISVKSMQWEKKNASYRRRARLAVAANDRTRKYIIRLTSSAMTLSLIAKEIFLDIRPVMDTAKGNLPFLAPVLSSSSLMELVTETLASLCAAWKPISLYPKDIKSSAPPQATHWLPRRLALLLPLPFNLGPTNQRLDKMLVERHLISDLLKHTGDRKQGCRAPEIVTFSVGPTPCLPDGKHWETLSGETTMMPLKRQVIFDWIFLQAVCASLTQYFFFLLVDRFGFLDDSVAVCSTLLGLLQIIHVSLFFACRPLRQVWGAVKAAFRLSAQALFTCSFCKFPRKWERLTLERTFKATEAVFGKAQKNVFLQCGISCDVFCFGMMFHAAIFRLHASRSPPAVFDRWEDPTVSDLSRWGRVSVWFSTTESNHEIRWGLVNQAQVRKAKEEIRGHPDSPCDHNFQKMIWDFRSFDNLASIKELITCPGWQMWRGRCCMTLAICTDSIFFFLHLFLVCQLGGEKNTLVSFLRSRKSIEHQHPSLTPTP